MDVKKIDTEKSENLIANAKRTIKIINLINQGVSTGDVQAQVGCNRQLVEYYEKALTKNDWFPR